MDGLEADHTISVNDTPVIEDFYKLNNLIFNMRSRDALAFIQDRKLTDPDYNRVCLNYDYETPNGHFKPRLESPVGAAAMTRDIDLLNDLVSLGFNPNAPCVGDWKDCRPPIVHACCDRAFESIEVLVKKHRVDVDGASNTGLTALKVAVTDNLLDIVKFLLENGANINYSGPKDTLERNTALHDALSYSKSVRMCEYLISQGADVNATGYDEMTPLHSVICARFDIMEDKTDGAEFKLCMVNTLIANGAHVNAENSAKCTPFHSAIRAHSLDLLKVLYRHGADPEAIDHRDLEPLHHAVMYGTYEIARYLVIDLNVSLNKRDYSRLASPLYMALRNNRLRMARLFVQAGYDLQQEDWVHDCYDPFSREVFGEDKFNESMKLVEEMFGLGKKVQTLQEICCFKVRHILGRQIPEALESLSLSHTVNDIIKLGHIQHVKRDTDCSCFTVKP